MPIESDSGRHFLEVVPMVNEVPIQFISRFPRRCGPPAAARLAGHLQHFSAATMVTLSKRAGVSGRAGARARAGRKVSATAYMLLCSEVGIEIFTGAPAPSISHAGLGIVWWLFGSALFFTRSRQNLDLRSVAGLIETSAATLSRAERGHPIAVENYLHLCRFIGLPPTAFLGFTGNTNCNILKINKEVGTTGCRMLAEGKITVNAR